MEYSNHWPNASQLTALPLDHDQTTTKPHRQCTNPLYLNQKILVIRAGSRAVHDTPPRLRGIHSEFRIPRFTGTRRKQLKMFVLQLVRGWPIFFHKLPVLPSHGILSWETPPLTCFTKSTLWRRNRTNSAIHLRWTPALKIFKSWWYRARLDVAASNFWTHNQQHTFSAIRVFNPLVYHPIVSLWPLVTKKHKQEKRRRYDQRIREVEHGASWPSHYFVLQSHACIWIPITVKNIWTLNPADTNLALVEGRVHFWLSYHLGLL